MPVTGSFSRSAVNHASGVRTPMGGMYTGRMYKINLISKTFTNYIFLNLGILIILALSLLTPYFYFIPKAVLAAVIISAVIFMIEYEIVKPMWKSSSKLFITLNSTIPILLNGNGVTNIYYYQTR